MLANFLCCTNTFGRLVYVDPDSFEQNQVQLAWIFKVKTVTVQNTPCIRQDSESESKKVRMSRNDDITILIPR